MALDAEWELRQSMGHVGNGYCVPAGIVRTANTSTLDFNCDQNIWGVADQGGDVDVIGTDHLLNLSGRTISYTGENFNLEVLTHDANTCTRFDVAGSAELEIEEVDENAEGRVALQEGSIHYAYADETYNQPNWAGFTAANPTSAVNNAGSLTISPASC